MSLLKLVIIFFLVSPFITMAQNPLNIINSPNYYVPCTDSCVNLKYDFLYKGTSTYTYTTNPYTYVAPASMTNIPMTDDTFSNAIPIGFNFCFYGASYNQCYISDNGIITFNPYYNGGSCNNNTLQTLPYYNNNFADAAIFGPFMDVDPTLGGILRYKTVGAAPYRRFVVEYKNVKLFGLSCSPTLSTFQIILNETTNIIDINIQNKEKCDGSTYFSNYATIGIQSIQAMNSLTIVGKNATIWTESNKSYSFKPTANNNTYVQWKDTLGNILGTADTLHYCLNGDYKKIICKVTDNCIGGIFYDTIVLLRSRPNIDSIHKIVPICAYENTGKITTYVSGGFQPYTYYLYMYGSLLVGTSISSTFNNVTKGSYQVVIADSLGCTDTATVNIQPVSDPNYYIIPNYPTCPDTLGSATAYINNVISPYTYYWSTGATTLSINNLMIDSTYTFFLSDSLGCNYHVSFTVQWMGLPTVTASPINPICTSNTGSINIDSISVATPPYIYYWSTGDTALFLDSLYPGVYVFTVIDSNNCKTKKVISLQPDYPILTNKNIIQTKCGLNNGNINITPYNSTGPYLYLWNTGDTTSSITDLSPGTYICHTYSNYGCSHYDTVVINSSIMPTLVLQPSNANCDTTNGIIIPTFTNAVGTINYSWSNGSLLAVQTGLDSGIYWLTATDAIGCVMKDTASLTQEGSPNIIVLSFTPPLCNGDSTGQVILGGMNGVPPYKYSVDGAAFTSIATINFITGGNYTLYVKDANGCLRDSSVFFDQPPLIGINITTDTVTCYGDSNAVIHFSTYGGIGSHVYIFDSIGAGAFVIDTLYDNLKAGIHTITVKDENNCILDFYVDIGGPDSALKVGIEQSDINCIDTFSAFATAFPTGGWGDYKYLWWPNGHQSSKIIGLAPGGYIVTVTDERGCTAGNYAIIEKESCCNFIIPNAFSPNGDNMNEEIGVITKTSYKSAVLKIFNRYGEMVFETENLQDRWNGSFKNKVCETGVYYYYLKTICNYDDEVKIFKGDIMLVR